MSAPSIVTARLVVRALLDQGLAAVAYCAGSRSAPFAYALAQAEQTEGLTVQTFTDERAASFWALGAARRLTGSSPTDTHSPQKWVAVFTTSGTAITHIQGALEEAKHCGLPLLAVTADRPAELIGTAASQTTDQLGFFDQTVSRSLSIPALCDLAEPCSEGGLSPQMQQWYGQVVRLVTGTGPAHLNVQFRDPLTPTPSWKVNQPLLPGTAHRTNVVWGKTSYPSWDEVVHDLPETVVIAGDRASREVGVAASAAGVPIVAEPSSGLCDLPTWMPHGTLLVDHFSSQIKQIVVTGRPTLSRPITRILAANVRKIVVSSVWPWPDQSGTADVVVAELSANRTSAPSSQAAEKWLQVWKQRSEQIETLLIAGDNSLNLFSAARMIWQSPQAANLWLGASNTVRAFDLAAGRTPAQSARNVLSNRGLAGIDGTIASAMGCARASGQATRVVLGDLTFAHDLTSLPATTPQGSKDSLGCDLTQIIVFNDCGGSIFASLEHGHPSFSSIFRKYFAIEQSLDIAAVAGACGWEAMTIEDLGSLRQALAEVPVSNTLLEVKLSAPSQLIKDLQVAAASL